MKIADIKEGKILGVNFVDLIVVTLVLFLAISFMRTVLHDPLSFSGEEVYKAVKTYNRLESKGFLAEAEVEATAVGDPTGSERRLRGLVVSARGGTLYIKNSYGDELSVGGSMSYLEDMAAKRITLIPVYAASLSFYSNITRFANFSQLMLSLEALKRTTGASSVVLSGEVSISQPETRFLEVKKAVESCYLCLNARVFKIGDDLYVLSLRVVELGELERLNLSSGEVVARNLRIYLGYEEELEYSQVEDARGTAKRLGFLRDVGEATYVSVAELL
ncbi:TrmB family transcriptional regulator sugar-binding domain-containing protein [Candidatus Pyrohabitans sp.]